MVACFAAAGTFPTAIPPSLRKSLSLRSETLPQPTTTSRAALRPDGAMTSRVDPLLPVKPSASAARSTRPPASPSSLRVAAPILRASSQNTIRTPLPGALKRSNSIFSSNDITEFPHTGCNLLPAAGAACFDRAAYPGRWEPSVGGRATMHVIAPTSSRGKVPRTVSDEPVEWQAGGRKASQVQALNHSSLNFNSFALRRPFCGRIKLICCDGGRALWGAPLGFRIRCDSTAGGDVLRNGLRGLDQF